MHFEVVGDISEIETIATGHGIRRLTFLRKRYGGRHWRKRKGIATVRLASGSIRPAVCRSGWDRVGRPHDDEPILELAVCLEEAQGLFAGVG